MTGVGKQIMWAVAISVISAVITSVLLDQYQRWRNKKDAE